MKTGVAFVLACLLLGCVTVHPVAHAQEQQTDRAKSAQTWSFYRLDFTVREMDNGKTLNTRSYTCNVRSGLSAGTQCSLRVGNRIPYSGEKGPSYLDVGFNVDCAAEEYAGQQAMQCTTELTTLPTDFEPRGSMPVLRTNRARAVVPFVVNKPILLSSADEVASTHRMQVEVTITQQK